ncbi:MAG: hypothetical protein A2161_10700, partial [Candidatus Schekmanbacteria bacterium RBG_13_48_7]
MKISEILCSDNIRIGLGGTTKNSVIEELVELIPRVQHDKKIRESIVKAIIAREKLCSTGIGEGVAIPHAKMDIPGSIDLVFGMTPHGIEFEAIDNKPVYILFLLLAGK